MSAPFIDENFSASPIFLDGRMKASLDWTKSREEAILQIRLKKKILWQVDLGLFSRLDLPLSDQMQFQSLCLTLEHFLQTLWKEFQSDTLGLVIYTGELDFSKKFPWNESLYDQWRGWLEDRFETLQIFNEEVKLNVQGFDQAHPQNLSNATNSDLIKLFCRDSAAEYLNLLTNNLPDSLKICMQMRVSEKLDPLLFFQLSTKERFERFRLIFDSSYSEEHEQGEIKIGICLPEADKVRPSQIQSLRLAMEDLVKVKAAFKVIPEPFLINQWDGLDQIIYSPKALSSQGKRKLQGFCAAGGQPVTVDYLLGLPSEILFKEFFSSLLP